MIRKVWKISCDKCSHVVEIPGLWDKELLISEIRGCGWTITETLTLCPKHNNRVAAGSKDRATSV